jgi:hypothetical protein
MRFRPRHVVLVALAAFLLSEPTRARADGALTCPKGAVLRTHTSAQSRTAWCVADNLFGIQKKNGPYKRWRSDGTLESEGEFIDGRRHGRWVDYDPSGNITGETEYRFGSVVASSGASSSPPSSPALETESQASARAPDSDPPAPITPKVRDEWGDLGSREIAEPAAPRSRLEPHRVSSIDLDNRMAIVQGQLVYAPAVRAEIAIGSFAIEGQYGISMWDAPSLGVLTESLNPTFVISDAIESKAYELSFGIGSSVPVVSTSGVQAALSGTLTGQGVADAAHAAAGLAAAEYATFIRGMQDFWLAFPDVPVLLLPARGRWRPDLPLELTAEVIPYVPIPIHGGSSDLALQVGGMGTYRNDRLRAGLGTHLVITGVTHPNPAWTLEPTLGIVLDPIEIDASFLAMAIKPSVLDALGGFIWSASVRTIVRFD